jgi:hypothetical protein
MTMAMSTMSKLKAEEAKTQVFPLSRKFAQHFRITIFPLISGVLFTWVCHPTGACDGAHHSRNVTSKET